MTSINSLIELVYLNGLLFDEYVYDVVKEVDINEGLESSIFVVQKAAAPKNGVKLCQRPIGTIRSSLATSQSFWSTHSLTHPPFTKPCMEADTLPKIGDVYKMKILKIKKNV